MKEKINESFYFPPDSEQTFSAYYFHENTMLDVSTIEENIIATHLNRLQKGR